MLHFWSGQSESNALRKHVIHRNGKYACEWCGISQWNEKEIVLEIDHIDGDASNASEENLRVLCPNCHSMTPTFRARNGTSARINR